MLASVMEAVCPTLQARIESVLNTHAGSVTMFKLGNLLLFYLHTIGGLLWGAVWGVTGMVLAVPITAVLRIRLSHIKHPLPQYVANLLVGEAEPPTAAGSPLLSVTCGSGDGGASGRGGHGDDDDAASSSGLLGHSVEMEAREADAHARRGSARSHQPLEAALEHDIETESAGDGAAVDGRQGLGR